MSCVVCILIIVLTIFAKMLTLLLCLTLFTECPDGLLCNSTIPSHYKRYSHFLLAASRAGNYLVNSSVDTLEREVTCPSAAKPSCARGHVEEISQNDKPSSHVKNGSNDDSTLVVHSSPQMKSLNTVSESTSAFADIQKPQQTFWLTQTTDNSCKFEFYDVAASQESETGEDLGTEKDTNQPSLLQSEVDFSDPEISYSPLSVFEESEEETEEDEKQVKTSQNKLLKDSKFEDEESNPVVFKTLDGHHLEQKPQYENATMGNFLIKKKHCEDVNTVNYLDQSVITVSQSLISKFCNSTCVDNQQEVLASGSCLPFNCEEVEQPELISSAAKAGNTESEDAGASALDSAYMSFTEASSLLVREDAESLLTQKSNVLKDPSNLLTDTNKMTANAIEETAPQESLQSVVEKEENPNTAAGCFHSPIPKTAPSLSLARRNAKSSSAKELKQMDIGVFFGLKPKVKEESKGETCLSEGKQMLSSETPSGKRPRQQKRKAEGSVEDVGAVTESSSKNGAFSDVGSSGQKRWRKKITELSTAGERTTKKHCPFYKKIPGEKLLAFLRG